MINILTLLINSKTLHSKSLHSKILMTFDQKFIFILKLDFVFFQSGWFLQKGFPIKKINSFGRGGGQVVSLLAVRWSEFESDVYNFSVKLNLKRTKINKKGPGLAHLFKKENKLEIVLVENIHWWASQSTHLAKFTIALSCQNTKSMNNVFNAMYWRHETFSAFRRIWVIQNNKLLKTGDANLNYLKTILVSHFMF